MKLCAFISWLQEIEKQHPDAAVTFAKFVKFSSVCVAGSPLTVESLTIDTKKLEEHEYQQSVQRSMMNEYREALGLGEPKGWDGIK